MTLFSHALDVTGDNARSHSNLGQALAVEGKTEEAIQHLLEAIRISPDHAVAHWAVGHWPRQQGRFEEAISYYETALRLKPDFPEALNNLAWIRATHPDPKYRDGACRCGFGGARLPADRRAGGHVHRHPGRRLRRSRPVLKKRS